MDPLLMLFVFRNFRRQRIPFSLSLSLFFLTHLLSGTFTLIQADRSILTPLPHDKCSLSLSHSYTFTHRWSFSLSLSFSLTQTVSTPFYVRQIFRNDFYLKVSRKIFTFCRLSLAQHRNTDRSLFHFLSQFRLRCEL